MKATIWHNPRCSKSRETLAVLQDTDAVVTVVDYMKEPPTVDRLRSLYAAAGLTPRQGLRADANVAGDDEAVLAAMAVDPAIIERPLVETTKGARLCRPPERVREIL